MSTAETGPKGPDRAFAADAEDASVRLVQAFNEAAKDLPDRVQGLAVVAALSGMIGGVLAALPDPGARRWAWHGLMRQIVRSGVEYGFAETGCGDPDCPDCGKGADGGRPVIQ